MAARLLADPKEKWSHSAKLLASGSGARIVTLPVGVVATAVTAAVAIRFGGDETYGYISLASTLFLILPFADLGLGAVIINAISARDREALQLVYAILQKLTMVGFAIGVLTLVGRSTWSWDSLLNVPSNIVGANDAITLTLLFFAISVPLGVGHRIFVGLGLVRDLTLWSALAAPLTTMLTVIVALAGLPAMYMAMAPTMALTVVGIILTHKGLRKLRGVHHEFQEEVRRHSLVFTALPYFITMVGSAATLNTGRLVISHSTTADQLAAYSLVSLLFLPALSIITTGSVVLWSSYRRPGANRLTLWKRALVLLTAFGGVVGTAFGLLAGPVSSVVSEGSIRPEGRLILGFSALLVVMAVHQGSGLLLTDGRGLWFQGWCVLTAAAVSIPLAVRWTDGVGAAGAILATLCTVLIVQALPTAIYARKVLREDQVR